MLHSICIHVLSLFLYSTFCELCGIFFSQAPAETVPQTSCRFFLGVLGVIIVFYDSMYVLQYFFILAWMVFWQAEFKSTLRPIEFSSWEFFFCELQIQNHLKTFLQSSCLQIVLITMLNSWLFGVQLKLKLWKKVFCELQIQNYFNTFLQSSCLQIVLITMLNAWLFGVQLELKLWILCAHKPTYTQN
jgi:hypothetical protein